MPQFLRGGVLALLSAPLLVVALAPSALAGPSDDLLSQTQAARAQAGLPGYASAGDLGSVAQQHAAQMAASGTLDHNPGLASDVCCWIALGENVGEGSSVDAVEQASLNSPDHRANILSPSYTEIGIGTAYAADGTLFVDEVFRQPTGAPAPVSAPAPPERSAPAAASRSSFRVPLDPIPGRTARLGTAIRALDRHRVPPDPLGRAVTYWFTMHALTHAVAG